MISRNLTGITVIGLIYIFTIFLRQPLSYILNLSVLPHSLLCLISGIFFFMKSRPISIFSENWNKLKNNIPEIRHSKLSGKTDRFKI